MQEMERLQAKGDVAEDELRALEEDMTGKVMISATHVLASNLLRDALLCRFCSHPGAGLASKSCKCFERQVNHLIHMRLFDTSAHADQVVDHVLKDREASEQTLVNRAKVNLSLWTARLMNHFGV